MLFRILVIFSCLAVVGCSAGKTLPTGSLAPFTKFQMVDGSFVSVSELRGKTAAVLFWSASCAASKRALIDLDQQMKRIVPRPDLFVVAVNIDDDPTKFKQVVDFNKITHVRLAYSGNGVYDEAYVSFRGEQVPMAIIIGPKGDIRAQGGSIDLSEL